MIKASGAAANISGGLAGATVDVFPISPEGFDFPPLFPGTVESTPPQNWWMYDHVWTQQDVCLDVNATVTGCPGFYTTQPFTYEHFMADDYTWAGGDETYFYFAWCDRSDPYSGQFSRPDPNIRLAKIKQ